METSEIISVSSTSITLLIIIFLAWRERTIIKSIKTFHELFDIEKFKDYNRLCESVTRLKYRELLLQKFEPIKEKLIPEMEAKFTEIYELKSQKLLEDYIEALNFMVFLWNEESFTSEVHESKEEFFKEFLPRNYEIIKGLIQDNEKSTS